jgi:hypothetical protein
MALDLCRTIIFRLLIFAPSPLYFFCGRPRDAPRTSRERRADMYASNLRRYIEALGGTLEITAHFPDGAVTIADVGGAEAGEK